MNCSNQGDLLRRILVSGNLFRNCKVKVEAVTDRNFVELKWQWKVDLKNNLTWQHFFGRWKFVRHVCITWNISKSRLPLARYHVRYSWKQAVFRFIKQIKIRFHQWKVNKQLPSFRLVFANGTLKLKITYCI